MTTTIKSLLCLFLLLNLMDLKSQREFLATLNPATGVHTRIDSIPGVNYIFQNATAFDKTITVTCFWGRTLEVKIVCTPWMPSVARSFRRQYVP